MRSNKVKFDSAAMAVNLRVAGRLLSISSRTVQRMIQDKRLRAVRIGRRVVVPISEVRRLLGDDIVDSRAERGR